MIIFVMLSKEQWKTSHKCRSCVISFPSLTHVVLQAMGSDKGFAVEESGSLKICLGVPSAESSHSVRGLGNGYKNIILYFRLVRIYINASTETQVMI